MHTGTNAVVTEQVPKNTNFYSEADLCGVELSLLCFLIERRQFVLEPLPLGSQRLGVVPPLLLLFLKLERCCSRGGGCQCRLLLLQVLDLGGEEISVEPVVVLLALLLRLDFSSGSCCFCSGCGCVCRCPVLLLLQPPSQKRNLGLQALVLMVVVLDKRVPLLLPLLRQAAYCL